MKQVLGHTHTKSTKFIPPPTQLGHVAWNLCHVTFSETLFLASGIARPQLLFPTQTIGKMASMLSWSMRSVLRSTKALPSISQPQHRIVNRFQSARLCSTPVVENQATSQTTSDDQQSVVKISDNCMEVRSSFCKGF